MNDAVSINIDNDPTCYEYEQKHMNCIKLKIDKICAQMSSGMLVPGTLVDGTVVPAADRVYWTKLGQGSRNSLSVCLHSKKTRSSVEKNVETVKTS